MERVDAENKFLSTTDELRDKWDVDMNFSLSGENFPDIEMDNRVLQAQFRCTVYF